MPLLPPSPVLLGRMLRGKPGGDLLSPRASRMVWPCPEPPRGSPLEAQQLPVAAVDATGIQGMLSEDQTVSLATNLCSGTSRR